MAKLMIALDFEIINVVYSNDAIGRNSHDRFIKIVKDYRICVHQSLSVDDLKNLTAMDAPKGIVYIGTVGKGKLVC